MNGTMFCFQCQECCDNRGCTAGGRCGKPPEVANLMDLLLQQLKILAISRNPTPELGRITAQTLFLTVTNTNFEIERLREQLVLLQELNPGSIVSAPHGVLATPDEDIRSLREFLTYAVKGIAAYSEHAARLGKEDLEIWQFIFNAFRAVCSPLPEEELFALLYEAGKFSVKAMALLDEAHRERYGSPRMSSVNTGVGTRPGILVSGHDLRDLEELLEQSKNAGTDIYTHGEMLPAHAYPELKKYPHLYGNYGNSWYRQQSEFESFNGAILMTSNCIVPVRESYRERMFTTGMAGFPGVAHIPDGKDNGAKDFSAVIAKALQCPPPSPVERKGKLVCGFGHEQLSLLTGKIVAAVKRGTIRRFVVMAGCDGRHESREYYTRFAEMLPRDTVILTAGCAKYRYNKLKLGKIAGIPRVIDAGQCNDCYSLLLLVHELVKEFKVKDLNTLPISFDIAWYEQKAVAVAAALLYCGVKNIRLGPTFPAFFSGKVTGVLQERYNLKTISTPEADVEAVMKGE